MLQLTSFLSNKIKMMSTFVNFFVTLLILSGSAHAVLYAEISSCNNTTGSVLEIVNNEVFSIAVCNDIKVFKEFSYCYDVEVGDTVNFDQNPGHCDMIGFTVMRNGVECGALCQ